MTSENGRPLTPGLPADRQQRLRGRVGPAGVYQYFIPSIGQRHSHGNRSCPGPRLATTSADVNAEICFVGAAGYRRSGLYS